MAEVIALDKPVAARAVVKSVFEETDRLGDFPRIGRAVPEFHHPGYNQLWVKPTWIYYRVSTDAVYILHVRRAEMLLDVAALIVSP
jgi:plasmid stabilization system protein ParE